MLGGSRDSRLPRGRHDLSREQVADSQRRRLLAAVAEELAESGRRRTTSGRVARRARVSPTTFYAHYEDVSACLLAAHEAASEALLGILARSCDEPQVSWLQRLGDGIGRTLRFLAAEPAVAHLLGPEAIAGEARIALSRAQAIDRLAAMLRSGRRLRSPGAPELPPRTEHHLVGAALSLLADRPRGTRASELPGFAPQLVEMLAAPFIQAP